MRGIRVGFYMLLVCATRQATVHTQTPVTIGPQAQAPPARDPVRMTGTASIRGRVVDATTGAPLRRVRMTLPGGTNQPRSTFTDEDGRYAFLELPAGTFLLTARKPGYLDLSYGQTRPREPAKPVLLVAGQVLNSANFALPRGGVITGRVVDEFGEPLTDARVNVVGSQYANGVRRPASAGSSATSNDIGEFRLFGIPPGDVYVAATLPTGMTSPTVPDDRLTYFITYYPGTPNFAQAQRVPIAAGQTVTGITIMLTPARAARVSGIAFDASGVPLRQGTVAVRSTAEGFGGMTPGSGSIRQDGTFRITNLPPGEYELSVMLPSARPGGMSTVSSARVVVADADLDNVYLSVRQPRSISGRLVVDPAAAGALRLTSLRLNASPLEPAAFLRTFTSAVREDGTFGIDLYPGRMMIVQVNGLPPGWMMRSARLNGRDISDGFDIGRDNSGELELELSSAAPDLTGTIASAAGSVVPSVFAVAFSQNPEVRQRSLPGHAQMTRVDDKGQFRFRQLLPDDYYVALVATVDSIGWTDPDFLETLVPFAQRVMLREGGAAALNFRPNDVR